MKILLGIDGSQYALEATRFVGNYLAQPGREVHLLHVLPASTQEGAAAPRQQPERVHVPPLSRSWLDRAEKRLRSRGFSVTRHVRRGVPARVVPDFVARADYDLIILGAKGRGDNPYLPTGSVALAMLEHDVPASIALVRERKLRRGQEVRARRSPFLALFATDGSARVERAARSFYHLFDVPDLQPVAIAVAELPGPAVLAGMEPDDRRQLIRQLGNAARVWARAAKPLLARPGTQPQARVLQGAPATKIVEEARRSEAQLVVLGSRGARSPSGPPLGSVALQVARFAPCSVLLVRER